MAVTPTTMPHPLASPPPPAARPVVTHPHTIRVTPGPAATDASSSGPRTRVPPAPTVTTTPNFYTTKAAAQKVLPPDVPGSVVKFTRGKGYYIGDAGRTPQGKKGGKAGATAGSSLDAQVNAALKAELDPQTAAINSGYAQILAELKGQQAKATADAAAQAQTVQGYYGAMQPMLAGIAPAVQGGYQDAANSIAGAAKGFSGALGDTATADAARSAQLLGENAAPDAQTAAAAQAAGTGGGAANALYGVGGYIPSAELSAQGAAAGAAARQLPATYAGIGAQNAAQALGVGSANAKDIGTTIGQQAQKHAADLATLAAGVPKLRNDIIAQYKDAAMKGQQIDFENKMAKYDLILKTGVDPLTGQLTPSARAQLAAITGTDPVTGKPTLKATTTQAAADAKVRAAQNKAIAAARKTAASDAKPNASLSRAQGVIVDSNGNKILGPDGKQQVLPGFKIGTDGSIVKTGKPAGKPGANPDYPNLTKSQVVHLRAGIAAAFNGVPEQHDANGKVVANKLPPVDYQTAIDHAVSAGYSRAAATRMANRFYMPGQRGRPAKPSPDTGFRGANLNPGGETPKGLEPVPGVAGVYTDADTVTRDKTGKRLYSVPGGYGYTSGGPVVFRDKSGK